MKKTIISILTATLLTAFTTTLTVFAENNDENISVSGGWSESTGYYVDNVSGTSETYISGTPSVTNLKIDTKTTKGIPSKTPDSHKGKRLSKVSNGGDPSYAAFGETVWYYKYHYTTARMELSNGTVKTTSGRQWGINATKATSPYYMPSLFQNTEARTYWGG